MFAEHALDMERDTTEKESILRRFILDQETETESVPEESLQALAAESTEWDPSPGKRNVLLSFLKDSSFRFLTVFEKKRSATTFSG